MSSAPPRTYARRHRRHSTAPTRSPSPEPITSPVKHTTPASPAKSPRRIVEVLVPRSPYHNRVRSPLKRAADSSDTTTTPVGSAKRRKIAPTLARDVESDSDIEEVFPSVLSNNKASATPGRGKARKLVASATPSTLRKSSAVVFDVIDTDEDALPEPPSTRRSPRKSTTIEPEPNPPPHKPPLKRVRHPIRLLPEASDQTDTRATSSSDDPLLLDPSPMKTVSKPASKRSAKPASNARSVSPVKPVSTTKRKPLSRTPSRLKASQSLPSTTSTPNATQVRRTNTLPTSQSNPSTIKGKGKEKGPLTKDLSDLFDFTSPDKDGHGAGLGERPIEPVARRMLARSRTEGDLSAEDSQESGAPSRILSRVNSFQPADNDVEMQDDALIFPLELSGDPSTETDTLPIPMRPPPVPLAGSASGSGLNSGTIKTYAGRSRSFLAPMPGSGMMDFDLIPEPASYRDLRKELGADDLDPLSSPPASPRKSTSPRKSNNAKGKARDDGLATLGTGKTKLAPNMHNDVRGLSELRNRGEARRFLDAVQDLFDGLAPESAPAIRRASALECLTKLCDKGFARRARASEFRSRVWEAMRARKDEGAGERDRILDACAAVFVGIVAREGTAELGELGRDEDFEAQCWELMGEVGRGQDVLELEAAGKGVSGRVERMNLTTLNKILAKVTSRPHPPLRAHLSLALSSLHPSALSPLHLPRLLDSLLPDITLLPSRLTGYTAGLSLLPDPSIPDGPSLEHVSHCLTMLDAFLLGRWGAGKDESGRADSLVEGSSAECKELAEGLLALAAACRILLSDVSKATDEETRAVVQGCLESALRVLVNLSHENAAWCALLLDQELTLPLILVTVAAFRINAPATTTHGVDGKSEPRSKSHVEGTGREDGPDDDDESTGHASEFDRLCLALGLLTNLVQIDVDGRAKDGVRKLNVNPSCPLTRACAQSCACTRRIPSLDVLAQLYLSTSPANEIEDSDHADVTRAVLRGYLAVLLGLLMRGSQDNTAALRHLKDDLLSSAREFAGLYAVVMQRVAKADVPDGDEDDEGGSGGGGFGAVSGDGSKGAEVAADVVKFLEGL